MTQPNSEPTPVPEGYEGYTPGSTSRDQPPHYQGQPQVPPPGTDPAYGYPPVGQQQQGYPPAPQYQGQPQMPPAMHPAYGYPQPKSKLTAGLLGIFLGGLGVHRFYLGYAKIGIIQILATILLSAMSFPVGALWGFVEGIMILTGSDYFRKDARGIPLRG